MRRGLEISTGSKLLQEEHVHTEFSQLPQAHQGELKLNNKQVASLILITAGAVSGHNRGAAVEADTIGEQQ